MDNTFVQACVAIAAVATVGLVWGCSGSGSAQDANAGKDAGNTIETGVDATLDTGSGGTGGSGGVGNGGANAGGDNTGGASVAGSAGTGGEQAAGSGGGAVCKPIPPTEHPRLLLAAGEENQINELIKLPENNAWKLVHDRIMDKVDSTIGEPALERVLVGNRLIDVSRELNNRVIALAYAYRISGKKKFLERAKNEMLAVARFSDWNPSHFLDVGEMTLGMAIGYDWLYGDLSEAARNEISNAIVKKGLEPSTDPKYGSWLKYTNNWNQVCHAGLTFGALAVQEDHPDLAKEIIDRAFENIPLAMDQYKPDGVYPEGYGYWEYGTRFNLYFIRAMLKAECSARGLLENQEAFLKSLQFMVHMVSPTGNVFNWSDNGNKENNQKRLLDPLFWMANRTSDLSLLYYQKELLIHRDYGYGPHLVDLLMYSKDINLEKIEKPQERMWVGQGDSGKNAVAMMRTSWTDSEGLYLGLKAGQASLPHGHMDVGSFVMDADGVRWASDPGPESYSKMEEYIDPWDRSPESKRWDVFRLGPLSHNVLTFDGQHQVVNKSAIIYEHSSSDAFMYAKTDLSPIYNGQVKLVKRGVAIKDAQYVVIQDEITTLIDRQTNVRWAMFTTANVKVENQRAILTIGDKTLYLKVKGSEDIAIRTWSTDPTAEYDSPNPGTTIVGFETTLPKNTSASFEVLLVPSKADAKATFVNEPLANW